MLEEKTIAGDQIEILADGRIQVRAATVILRDGVRDPAFPPRYHRYVLGPGDDLTGKDPRIAAIAAAAWTPDVVAAYQQAIAAARESEEQAQQ